MTLEVLATKVEAHDRRAFAAIARSHDRCESAELRRLVRAYVRGQVTINESRPTEQGHPQEVTHG